MELWKIREHRELAEAAAAWFHARWGIPEAEYAGSIRACLAGGAAVVGCACHMVGFAVMSFKENGWSGLVSQGIGTSMLQIPNVMKNPKILLPPIVASAVCGPLSTCLFRLKCGATGGGMGTAGLVGVFSTIEYSTDISAATLALGIILLFFVLPGVICALLTALFNSRKRTGFNQPFKSFLVGTF